MAGLSLMGSAGFGSSGLPTAANQPTGTTISQGAFGVSAVAAQGPATAANGAVLAGLIGVGVLVWLWWTLPR